MRIAIGDTEMDAKAALEVIRANGVYKLADFDGCLCGDFRIKGINVDISCRKSGIDASGAYFLGIIIRVHSRSLDADGPGLLAIAKEVASQLKKEGYPILVRFCNYHHDKERICIYCEEKRSDPLGYLCDACLNDSKPGTYVDQTVADERDYRSLDFTLAIA